MSYIFFANDIKVPCIAAAEEFLKITLVNHILRVSGAFFIKRRVAGDHLYMAILSEYVQQLLKDSQILEFFIEGTRSRSGKTLHPKFGILSMCTEAYFEGLVPNVHFVPITINYERVLEGETFPFELLGEEKVKESLMRLAKSIKTLNMNFGKIEIVVNDPISIKDFCFKNPSLDPSNLQDRDILNKKLGFEIVYTLQDNTVIMPTSLTATILLMHTRGVTEDELVAKVDWLRNEIRARGYKVGGMNGGSGATEVKNAICHLNDFITRKKDIFEPSVSLKSEYKNILMLSYYRNALHHIFIIEALIACTLNRFSTKNNQDIPKEKIISESVFLWNLIEREFVCRNSTSQVDTLEFTIQSMIKRGYIIENSNNIQIQPSGEMAIAFLSSLLWPMIDSYWITLMFSVALRTRPQLTFDRIVQSVQMYAEIMYEERSMYFYESCSQENIKNALHTYEKMGIIGKTTADKSLALTNEYITNESKLEELVDHIGNFRKTSLIRTNSTFEDLKRSIIDEFPLMPKI